MLETQRLFFRPYNLNDLDFYASLVSDPEMMRYIGEGVTRTRQEAEGMLAARVAKFAKTPHLGLQLLIRKADNQPIGHAGLVPQTVEGADEVEIGYWIARDHWGNGYASEAAAALRDFGIGMLGLVRLVSLIQHPNTASKKVAERIGMTYERPVTYNGKEIALYSYLHKPST